MYPLSQMEWQLVLNVLEEASDNAALSGDIEREKDINLAISKIEIALDPEGAVEELEAAYASMMDDNIV